MMSNASQSGTFKRLRKGERLRSKPYQKNQKVPVLKTFKFVLINNLYDHEDKTIVMNEDIVHLRGIIQIANDASEKDIRMALKEAINKNHSYIGENDFEFLSANRRTLSKPVTSCEFNYNTVKLLCGQGAIYIRMKEEMEFFLEIPSSDEETDQNEEDTNQKEQEKNQEEPETVQDQPGTDHKEQEIDKEEQETEFGELEIITQYCHSKKIVNPVEIIRVAQNYLVKGRKLEIDTLSIENVGPTNCIFVNRHDILTTAKEEIEDLMKNNNNDIKTTLEVSFYGEMAKDLGGPRKEFFRLILKEIQQKYFLYGLREELKEDYEFVGVTMSLSILTSYQKIFCQQFLI